MVGVDAAKFFAIVIENGNQPMAVFAPLILAELCSLSFYHVVPSQTGNYGKLRDAAQVAISGVTPRQTEMSSAENLFM
jgi:hypothetical protein